MGIFDFFRRRREPESTVKDLGQGAQPPQPAGSDLSQLGELGAFVHQAPLEGKVEVDRGMSQQGGSPYTGPREEEVDASGGGDSGGGDSGGGRGD